MTPISKEKRELIVKHKRNKKKDAEIAEWVDVSIRSISRIWKMYKNEGNLENKMSNSGRKSNLNQAQILEIIAKIEEQPDITLLELIDELSLNISESGLSKLLKKLNFTLKKRLFIQKNKSEQM